MHLINLPQLNKFAAYCLFLTLIANEPERYKEIKVQVIVCYEVQEEIDRRRA